MLTGWPPLKSVADRSINVWNGKSSQRGCGCWLESVGHIIWYAYTGRKGRWLDRSFSCYAPRLWNRLPDSIKGATSVETFKRLLKHHLFQIAYSQWLLLFELLCIYFILCIVLFFCLFLHGRLRLSTIFWFWRGINLIWLIDWLIEYQIFQKARMDEVREKNRNRARETEKWSKQADSEKMTNK